MENIREKITNLIQTMIAPLPMRKHDSATSGVGMSRETMEAMIDYQNARIEALTNKLKEYEHSCKKL